jgi:hypothetical protein
MGCPDRNFSLISLFRFSKSSMRFRKLTGGGDTDEEMDAAEEETADSLLTEDVDLF